MAIKSVSENRLNKQIPKLQISLKREQNLKHVMHDENKKNEKTIELTSNFPDVSKIKFYRAKTNEKVSHTRSRFSKHH